MSVELTPAKVVLLAVHFTAHANIAGVRELSSQYMHVLRPNLLYRILLSYLPEITPPSSYTPFVLEVAKGDFSGQPDSVIDSLPVDHLSDEEATKRLKKLSLPDLDNAQASSRDHEDPLTLFLLQRSYKMDEEAGMLSQIPELVSPFLDLVPVLRTWLAATVVPLLRRNSVYYTSITNRVSLFEFQNLADDAAVEYLLSQTGKLDNEPDSIGRDLRGMLNPWLREDSRWSLKGVSGEGVSEVPCAGWQKFLSWLVLQGSSSWELALNVAEQWDGPNDVDFDSYETVPLSDFQSEYLEQSYAQATLASALSVPDATEEALDAVYRMVNKVKLRLRQQPFPSIQTAAADIVNSSADRILHVDARRPSALHIRNDLLEPSNALTTPDQFSTDFLMALVLSAYILTRLGAPCSVKRAGELVILQDRRDQKNELLKLIRLAGIRGASADDAYWQRVRSDVLWLHKWLKVERTETEAMVGGVFGTISREEIETELLKAMLSSTPVRDAAYQSALDAFDNASNPNRTRGGLRKCNDIIHALESAIPKHSDISVRIEALLCAAHALSQYRLVLKQGESFHPVVLRVHSDPISLLEKVLEQNPHAYTRLTEFLELGSNLVLASHLTRNTPTKSSAMFGDKHQAVFIAEKRVVAMCILAALREEDFETAYSYVVSRLAPHENDDDAPRDEWSWKAALQAGQYVRNSRTQMPTHLGTASGNPEIRHLEQRIECLSTALRVAPTQQLKEILTSFRRCEEQLNSAIQEEAAKEAAWDADADMQGLPGAFDTPNTEKAYPPRNMTAVGAARRADEAPMSLFDLSRATAQIAQRNLTVLSDLRDMARGNPVIQPQERSDEGEQQRIRKRDQLREAATGTLVSSVGWLIGATPSTRPPDS